MKRFWWYSRVIFLVAVAFCFTSTGGLGLHLGLNPTQIGYAQDGELGCSDACTGTVPQGCTCSQSGCTTCKVESGSQGCGNCHKD